jgi:hypothetical protein
MKIGSRSEHYSNPMKISNPRDRHYINFQFESSHILPNNPVINSEYIRADTALHHILDFCSQKLLFRNTVMHCKTWEIDDQSS